MINRGGILQALMEGGKQCHEALEVEIGWSAAGSLKLTRAGTASTSTMSGNGAGNACGMVCKIGISEGQHMSALIRHLQTSRCYVF